MHRCSAAMVMLMTMASVQALSGLPTSTNRNRADAGCSLCKNLLFQGTSPGLSKEGAMRLRGGNPDSEKLRDLLRKKEDGTSLLDLLTLALSVRPVTRILLLTNLASYIASSLGWMGADPVGNLGFRSDKVLESPMHSWHRILSSHWLHASHAHLVGNMLVLLAVGGKLEEHLGSSGLARLVFTLLPVVGITQVSLTIAFNSLLRLIGFGKLDMGNQTWFHDLVRQQANFGTTSVGFSAVLFALNSVVSFQLESENVEYCVSLASLPPSVRMPLMRMLGINARDKLMSKDFCIPSRVWPLVQILLTQLADPARLSLTGHLAGLVAALSIKSISLGLLSIPVHISTWLFARNFLKIHSPPQVPIQEPNKPWNMPALLQTAQRFVETFWKLASSVLQGGDAPKFEVGDLVIIENLTKNTELNNHEARVQGILQGGRVSVLIVGQKFAVAVSKNNLRVIRKAGHEKYGQANENVGKRDEGFTATDVEKWSVTQVSDWLRKKGYGQLQRVFESHAIGGHALLLLTNQDLAEMKVPIGTRKQLQWDIEKLKRPNTGR